MVSYAMERTISHGFNIANDDTGGPKRSEKRNRLEGNRACGERHNNHIHSGQGEITVHSNGLATCSPRRTAYLQVGVPVPYTGSVVDAVSTEIS